MLRNNNAARVQASSTVQQELYSLMHSLHISSAHVVAGCRVKPQNVLRGFLCSASSPSQHIHVCGQRRHGGWLLRKVHPGSCSGSPEKQVSGSMRSRSLYSGSVQYADVCYHMIAEHRHRRQPPACNRVEIGDRSGGGGIAQHLPYLLILFPLVAIREPSEAAGAGC